MSSFQRWSNTTVRRSATSKADSQLRKASEDTSPKGPVESEARSHRIWDKWTSKIGMPGPPDICPVRADAGRFRSQPRSSSPGRPPLASGPPCYALTSSNQAQYREDARRRRPDRSPSSGNAELNDQVSEAYWSTYATNSRQQLVIPAPWLGDLR